MKKTILLVWVLLSFSAASYAQNETSIGFRLDIKRAGFTLQQSLGEKSKLEGLLTFSKEDVVATGLYEYHHPIGPKGLTVYGGLGGHYGKFYKSHARGYS